MKLKNVLIIGAVALVGVMLFAKNNKAASNYAGGAGDSGLASRSIEREPQTVNYVTSNSVSSSPAVVASIVNVESQPIIQQAVQIAAIIPGVNYSYPDLAVKPVNESETGFKPPELVAKAAQPSFQYYKDKYGNTSFTLNTWANPIGSGVYAVYG